MNEAVADYEKRFSWNIHGYTMAKLRNIQNNTEITGTLWPWTVHFAVGWN